jgi:hypothetical protein
MKSDILILSDALLEPPSESYAIRYVTMVSHDDLDMNVLIHTSQDLKDLYYKWMKTLGLMDYVAQLLVEWEWEEGVRIDIEKHYPNTIITRAIRYDNQVFLVDQVRGFVGK